MRVSTRVAALSIKTRYRGVSKSQGPPLTSSIAHRGAVSPPQLYSAVTASSRFFGERRGHAGDVLDGPLSALKHLVGLLEKDSANPQLAVGEIITTGTLTKAMPVKPGERWTTKLSGIPLGGIEIQFE